MLHILWLNLAIILTIFPGLLLFCINRFSFLRKVNEMDKYVVCLMLVVFINMLNSVNLMLIIILIIVLPIALFVIEYILNEWGKLKWNKFKYVLIQIKRPMYVMILYPILEELIYRYYVYSFVSAINRNIFIYCFTSVCAFIFVHFFNQRVKCLYKIPFAIVESLLFFVYEEILLCIIIHMCCNILVYAYNSLKYGKGKMG